MNISKFVTPEIIFGCGALSQLGESAARLGASRVFVVSDAGVIAAGWIEPALDYLHSAGLATEVFAELTTNPKDYEVVAGVKQYLAGWRWQSDRCRQGNRPAGNQWWPAAGLRGDQQDRPAAAAHGDRPDHRRSRLGGEPVRHHR